MADVDAILASGEYRDRKGRTWVLTSRLLGAPEWAHDVGDGWFVRTPDQMRTLITRDLHRDKCPGLALCERHPAPQVWKEGHSWFLGTGWEVIEYPTLAAALDAARHMTGAA